MSLSPLWRLSTDDLEKIHKATLSILETEGIEFLSDKVIDVFKTNGFKVEDHTVYFTDEQIQKALSTCPSSFTIHARNPQKNVVMGEREAVCSPIYGPPYVIDFEGNLRRSTLADYETLVKLNHVLPSQNLTGFILCDPSDVPADKAHKYMLYSAMTLSDQPFMGSPTKGAQGVEDMMQMAEILFAKDREYLKEHPFSISLINSLTPLRYECHAAEALMEFAKNKQPMLIASLVTGGATGPITLAGILVVQNAEILAGIVLSQLVNPGTPIVYGCASGVMDMRTVIVALGAPEFSKIMRAGVQLGHWYGLPCRGGGCLTESCDIDAQAGYESMGSMLTATELGVDFVQHSIGCVASYMGASFTKFILDDEIIMHCKNQAQKIDLSDSEEGFALDIIREVGKGGEYLTNLHTAMHCRDGFIPEVAYRGGLESWFENGKPSIKDEYKKKGLEFLESYKEPTLDPVVRDALKKIVEQ